MRYWFAAVAVAGMIAGQGGEVRAQIPDDLRTGYEAYKSGQFEQAADAFGRAIQLGGLDQDALAVTLNNRGVAYSQLGRYDDAIADYLEAQKLKADDPTTIRNLRFAYLTRGLASANQGDRAAALQDYDRALAIDPNYLEALQYRGALRVEMGANAEASADFRRVLALEPDNAAATAALAALEGKPATAEPAPVASEPAETAVPRAAEGAAPDSVQAAVARTQAAQERAQASLDEALRSARAAEPAAAPEGEPVPEAAEAAPTVPEAKPSPPAPAETVARPAPAEDARAAAEPPAPAPRTPEAQGSQRYRVTTSVNLRGGPGNAFPVIGSLAQDQIVRPNDEDLGWYRIPGEGQPTGWVYRRFLDPIQ
jgi:predicted TPR repeat methyltransferase